MQLVTQFERRLCKRFNIKCEVDILSFCNSMAPRDWLIRLLFQITLCMEFSTFYLLASLPVLVGVIESCSPRLAVLSNLLFASLKTLNFSSEYCDSTSE